jgi:ZIP family zinc transporter
MGGYLLVLGLAALPAAGNFAGGVLAEIFRSSERTLSLALHLAAGIVLAVVGLELMPEALGADLPWVPLLAFVGGGAAFIGLDRAIGYVQARMAAATGRGARWRSSPASRWTSSATA